MTESNKQTSSVTKMIEQVLERGEIALVVTKVRGQENLAAKLLLLANGDRFGSLGESELDLIVSRHAAHFLVARDETRMFSVSELEPNFPSAAETSLLFERLQPAPRLVVCGAGHVGGALARLAAFTGYHTTLIDDRSVKIELASS